MYMSLRSQPRATPGAIQRSRAVLAIATITSAACRRSERNEASGILVNESFEDLAEDGDKEECVYEVFKELEA